MKIGILQTGHSPDNMKDALGDYGDMFVKLLGGHGFDFQIWSVVDGDFPASAVDADGWLITGSKHGAYEDHDWIPPLEQLIRAIREAGRPLVGICFGHQIIAQALGGKVEKFAGGWSVGRTEYTIDGETLALNAWHQDQVTQLPDGAKVVGASDFCANAALLYDDHIWTIQPHPEFTQDFIDGLIRTRGKGVVPDHQLQAASALLDAPTDNAKIADHIADFLKKERL
ncbi:type 1 glutamine amidotransferase [Sulfitobacter pontiacus]|jgi:GMP synthase (glutamine-hydrolysing)|uniref:type 1 glutamine amidotransferase n=1 Tax=Sulfitobacter pontiacus TaxID=60137 RepID=UPI000E9D968B|nr:type 1 glutamine amidotransferase [Sulfitobacter pontiacus]QLL42277.1 type 1 glutamine amidotransferase [Sulfitobacter pontiacus]HBM41198.1 glutamine amidotransferase [Sulfitobacter sp.]